MIIINNKEEFLSLVGKQLDLVGRAKCYNRLFWLARDGDIQCAGVHFKDACPRFRAWHVVFSWVQELFRNGRICVYSFQPLWLNKVIQFFRVS